MFGGDAGDLGCGAQSPADWISDLLISELVRAGFRVDTESANAQPDTLQIHGRLQRLFTEALVGGHMNRVECDLQVTLEATTQTGLRAERTFFAKRRVPGDIRMATFYRAATAKAARWLVTDMVNAVVELADRESRSSRALDPKLHEEAASLEP